MVARGTSCAVLLMKASSGGGPKPQERKCRREPARLSLAASQKSPGSRLSGALLHAAATRCFAPALGRVASRYGAVAQIRRIDQAAAAIDQDLRLAGSRFDYCGSLQHSCHPDLPIVDQSREVGKDHDLVLGLDRVESDELAA